MGSKLISNSLTDRNITYFECECGSEFLYLEKFHTDEVVIGYIGKSESQIEEDWDEFLFKDLEHLCRFHYYCFQMLEHRRNSFISVTSDLVLRIDFDKKYRISVYSTTSDNEKLWDILLTEDAFEEFTCNMREILDMIALKQLPFSLGMQVEIKSKETMHPKYIDEIGRYHFDLGDGSDIIFNTDMASYSGYVCTISEIHPFVDIHGKVNCTIGLKSDKDSDNKLWFYMFSPDMVNIIA